MKRFLQTCLRVLVWSIWTPEDLDAHPAWFRQFLRKFAGIIFRSDYYLQFWDMPPGRRVLSPAFRGRDGLWYVRESYVPWSNNLRYNAADGFSNRYLAPPPEVADLHLRLETLRRFDEETLRRFDEIIQTDYVFPSVPAEIRTPTTP